MNKLYTLDSACSIYIDESDKVYFNQPGKLTIMFSGSLYKLLVSYLLEKPRIMKEIIDQFHPDFALEKIYYVVFRLQKSKVLFEVSYDIPELLREIAVESDLDPQKSFEIIKSKSIEVISLSQMVEKNTFVDKLNEYGINTSVNTSISELTVLLIDDYADPKLKELCQNLVDSKKEFIIIRSFRFESFLGPILGEEKSCYKCLLLGIGKNRADEILLKKMYNQVKHASTIKNKYFLDFQLSKIATEILKYILDPSETALLDHLISFNADKFKKTEHFVFQALDCEACRGKCKSAVNSEIHLTSNEKKFTSDGGDRVEKPLDTYNRLKKYISPITGIVPKLCKSDINSELIHVHHASFSNSKKKKNLKTIFSGAAGKGKGEVQSKVSCICEAIERYIGSVYNSKVETKLASYVEVKDNAICPNLLQNYSSSQYKNRDEINALKLPFNNVPELFDKNEKILWTKIWSLTNQKNKWIPLSYSQYSFDTKCKYIMGNSNGCASGNNLEEAILQGFYELVERDQCGIWWYSMLQLPELDLSTFSDPYINKIQREYSSLKRKIWVLDLTLDLKIPTFAAVSVGKNVPLILGLGTHLNPNLALSRALSEMNQSLDIEEPVLNVKGDEPYLLPRPGSIKRTFNDFENPATNDLKEDILICKKIVEEKGLEMLVMNQTRPEIDLCVARVVVPGLRHFWARFDSGRLYDVPLQLNLLSKKLREEELNPVPITF